MDQDSVHMVAASKVPMLKPGEYELWRMRMEQYIQMIDYSLWEVIENDTVMSSDEASSGVTYTSISSDYEEPSEVGSPGVIALLLPDYVSGPEYPKYLAPSDEEVPVEDQPYDGPADYPANRGDDDDDDSSRDDSEDEDEEEASKEEEEHLASADSTAVASPVVDPIPSAEETEPFETNESAMTPPPPPVYRTTARMSIRAQTPIPFPSEAKVDRLLAMPTPPPSPLTPLSSPLPQIPSPPLPVPSPLATSHTYIEAPLGFRAARIRLRIASLLPSPTSLPTHHPLPLPLLPPPVNHKEDIPKADILPHKRLCLTAPTSRFEVGESLIAVAARQPDLGAARTTDYGFADMLVDAIREGAPTTLEGVNARVTKLAKTHERDTQDLYAHLEDAQDSQARLSGKFNILIEDSQFYQQTVLMIEDEARVSREAWAQAMGCNAAIHYEIQAYRAHTQMQDLRISSQEALIATLKMTSRRGARTRTTPATATTTTLMTDAAIRALIAQGVADALAG
ncbi:hypothetical protein Tco_0025252 [Tanacetum coccineum]